METAVLFHLTDWKSEKSSQYLSDGISLRRTEGTELETLYNQLCETSVEMKDEFFSFPSHLLLDDSPHDESIPYYGGPYSIISRISSIIVICTSYPLGFSRLILSKDGFASAWISTVAYEDTPQMEILRAYPDYLTVSGSKNHITTTVSNSYYPTLDDDCLVMIKTCWNNLEQFYTTKQADNHRLENALSYFFYSWRAYYMEHVCLNLVIVLETLFSPSSQHELSHSIAFNVSKFCSSNQNEREAIYRTIKKFYGVRSQIVHGGEANLKNLHNLTPKVFQMCARILKQLLLEYSLIQSFGCEANRKQLLSKWMFGD